MIIVIKVSVPATSANMGPGFDSMGISLGLFNHFYIEEIEEGFEISGCPLKHCSKDNLVYTSLMKFFEEVGYTPKGISIKIESDIPLSRGLGSSASCILGGVLAGNHIAKSNLNQEELLNIAAKIEGHPDNIAPALLGGMVISINEGEKIFYERIEVSKDLKFCALIPDFSLSTKESRAVLPKEVPYEDAIFNVSHASIFVSAMISGNHGLIKYACKDKLHQDYRGTLIPNYQKIIDTCNDLNCVGAFLSGAGPTIMVILKEEDAVFSPKIKDFLDTLEDQWKVVELKPDFIGATIEK